MMGKFTKTGKFRLAITYVESIAQFNLTRILTCSSCLSVISPFARSKIWVKPNGEMPFLYGGNGTNPFIHTIASNIA